MDVIVSPSSVEGETRAPPSKSYTHRALFASLLADGRSVILDPLVSSDTEATIDAVRLYGARLSWGRERIEVTPEGLRAPRLVYSRGSGTTIRIASAVAALLEEPVTLYGNESLNKRPMGPLMRALKELGAEVSCSRACTPPVTVKGFNWKPRTRIVSVDASISSQFVTALLIISPLLELELLVEGRIRSRPYIDVTLSVLEAYGLRVEREGYRRFRVKGEYRPRHYSVPGDYSSASFILAAGALAGRVLVRGLKQFDPQGDRAILEILASMGAKVRVGSDWVLVENTGGLEAIEADLADYPDLAPIVSVLAAYARGQTVLTGIGHLAYKESNRVEAIVGNLRRIGVEASVKDPETLVIKGGGARGGTVVSYGDHRIAMSFAVAGLRARKGVKILGVDCVRDSYPGFLRDLSSIGANIETIT